MDSISILINEILMRAVRTPLTIICAVVALIVVATAFLVARELKRDKKTSKGDENAQ